MSILKVARMGHPVLRQRAREVERAELLQPSIQKFIDDMIDTMHEYHGVGLAAPQVHEGLRIFVAAISPSEEEPLPPDSDPMVFVNPVITPVGQDVFEDWEGCLSIPGPSRPRAARARDHRHRGRSHRQDDRVPVAGFPARVIQHETDHLDGVLFLDRMRDLGTLSFFDEYQRHWTKD